MAEPAFENMDGGNWSTWAGTVPCRNSTWDQQWNRVKVIV